LNYIKEKDKIAANFEKKGVSSEEKKIKNVPANQESTGGIFNPPDRIMNILRNLNQLSLSKTPPSSGLFTTNNISMDIQSDTVTY